MASYMDPNITQMDQQDPSMKTESTTSTVGLKYGHIRKNLTKNGEPQRHSWEGRRRRRKISKIRYQW